MVHRGFSSRPVYSPAPLLGKVLSNIRLAVDSFAARASWDGWLKGMGSCADGVCWRKYETTYAQPADCRGGNFDPADRVDGPVLFHPGWFFEGHCFRDAGVQRQCLSAATDR